MHRHCIELDLLEDDLTKEQRRNLLTANKVITELLDRNGPNVLDWNHGHATGVDKFYTLGDEVMLYGAYLGECLRNAKSVLENKGVIVHYNEIGCVEIY